MEWFLDAFYIGLGLCVAWITVIIGFPLLGMLIAKLIEFVRLFWRGITKW